MEKTKRLFQGAIVVAAIIVTFYSLTPETALALIAIILEVLH